MRLLGSIFGGVGLLLTIIGGVALINEQLYLSRAIATTGTVITFSQATDAENYTIYCPQIGFTSRSEQEIIHTVTCSTPPDYKKGDVVELYYDPANPTDVQLNNFWDQYTLVFVLWALGLPFLAIGAYLLIEDFRNPEQPKRAKRSGL